MSESTFGKPSAEIKKITAELDRSERWLVLAHEKPDGDTMGCAFAMAHLGLRLSKTVMLGGPDPCPERYRFIGAGIASHVLEHIPEEFTADGSAVICLDTSTK
ncbi:MAG: hypothetical protein LBQ56_01855, partial [Synergistaceae bacterium]|nr:hypothetical protein [Synergistaceae bacterium]